MQRSCVFALSIGIELPTSSSKRNQTRRRMLQIVKMRPKHSIAIEHFTLYRDDFISAIKANQRPIFGSHVCVCAKRIRHSPSIQGVQLGAVFHFSDFQDNVWQEVHPHWLPTLRFPHFATSAMHCTHSILNSNLVPFVDSIVGSCPHFSSSISSGSLVHRRQLSATHLACNAIMCCFQ